MSENSHNLELQSFARKLSVLLMLRGAVQWITVWFFIWGVVVLAARISGVRQDQWLLLGLLGAVPLAVVAAAREWRRQAEFSRVRAAYDRLNECGGMIMAEETADMSAWRTALPRPAQPELRWRGGKAIGLLLLSALFVGVALSLPERFANVQSQRPLEIGKLIGELNAEVEVLKEERILDEVKAQDLQEQLARLKEESSAADPNKTWEALDHIKESNAGLAEQAAEEALSKLASLAEAETLASALDLAARTGLGEETMTRAAQDLAGMLAAAKLDQGLLNAQLPPELLNQLSGLDPKDLQKLLSALQASKGDLGRMMTNLANLRMIDAKRLGQCQGAGQCPNPEGLAAFLKENGTNCNSIASATLSYCRGGIDRGRGDAPMTWKDPTGMEDMKFKENPLPASTRLNDAQVVGLSKTAPQLSDDAAAGQGALAGANAGGGSANSQVILPRHKQAVQEFFKREQ